MNFYTLDFESYYNSKDGYTLRKMTPIEYCLDPRFECIGCSVTNEQNVSMWLTADQLKSFLVGVRAKGPVAFISHNALFDMTILAIHFGFVPNLMVDTLGMARARLRRVLRNLSLENIAQYLNLGAKGNTIKKVDGMSGAAIIAAGLMDEFADYAIQDGKLCFAIFKHFIREGYPTEELQTMDAVLRMTVQPVFKLDINVLTAHAHNVASQKAALLAAVGMTNRDDLMSNDRFAVALQTLGVDPPMKVSPSDPNKMIYAFAKTDTDFTDLEEEHPDPRVQALVAARLGVKSTIEETRTQRLINISRLVWPDGSQGWMPFPLKYAGAHTLRLSGEWKLNMQNLPRGGELRNALICPPGYIIVCADASQIEARIVACFSRQLDLMAQFAAGEDVYSTFASIAFGFPVNKKDHPDERFMGKTAVLGLGFGLGWLKFQNDIKVKSGLQLGKQIVLTDAEAKSIVDKYRGTYSKVPGMWKTLQNMLPLMTNPTCDIALGPIRFQYNRIRLPDGMFLYYEGLHWDVATKGWRFFYGGEKKYIYGGKMMENIIQALARIITMGAARRATPRIGYNLALQVHDELGYVIPENLVDITKQILLEEMVIPPEWMPDLPLAADAGSGVRYGEAK